MKIVILAPKYNFNNNINYDYNFPLGLAYISAAIKNKGYDLDCFNLNHINGKTEDIVKELLNKKKYDVLLTGHMGFGYNSIEKILLTSKQHETRPFTIIGGAIITPEPRLIFESLKPDIGVIGEGELTILEILKALEKKSSFDKIKGIIYSKNNETIINPQQKLIENLDSIPFPDFEGFGFEEQLDNLSFNGAPYGYFDYPRTYPILCSRGCPFQCTFCYHCLGLKYRTRSIKNVMTELKFAINKYRINTIDIHDDLFSVNKDRLYKFCKEIKKLLKEISWDCKWTCQLSVHNVDKEMLMVLKSSGCYAVSFGFESYNPQVLKSMKKPITPQQIDNAIKLSLEAGMSLQGNFIFGDVAETKETAKETLDYWKNNCKGQIHLGFIQPYPGSKIYEYCVQKGIIKDKLDYIKNHMMINNWYNMTDSMSDKEIEELKKEILNARVHEKYVSPKIISLKNKEKKRYNLLITCPFCNEDHLYKNCYIPNKKIYTIRTICRSCNLRYSISSPFYRFAVKNHSKLDFFMRKYLFIKDKLMKSRL